MDWWQALVLGLVEGLTEYLPVSSTGHLLLTQRLMGIGQTEVSDAFAISVQGGAIVAVLGLYFRRVRQMAFGVFGKDPEGARLAAAVVAAFLPAAVVGLLLEKPIKQFLFGAEFGLWPVVFAWFVGGAAILVVGWARRRSGAGRPGMPLGALGLRMALVIGFAQCLAMWPGVSRSLVTIVGGVLVGLGLPAAVEFSFLLGVVTLGAATAYDLVRHGQAMLAEYGAATLLTGFLAAWISAVLAVRWMVGYLNSHGMALFGYYRIGLALVVAALLASGFLDA
jgi:undecaprenyl-diphosphatase